MSIGAHKDDKSSFIIVILNLNSKWIILNKYSSGDNDLMVPLLDRAIYQAVNSYQVLGIKYRKRKDISSSGSIKLNEGSKCFI